MKATERTEKEAGGEIIIWGRELWYINIYIYKKKIPSNHYADFLKCHRFRCSALNASCLQFIFFSPAPFHLLHKAFIIKKWCEKCQNRRSNLVMFAHKLREIKKKMLLMQGLVLSTHLLNQAAFIGFLDWWGRGWRRPPLLSLPGCSDLKSTRCFTMLF